MEIFEQNISSQDVGALSPLALAFIGDAVHTLFVRNKLLCIKNVQVGSFHSVASNFCRASYQAKMLDSIELSEQEQDIVRRARNAKVHNIPKNSDIAEYKKATCYEALLGWLWLTKQQERLFSILKQTNNMEEL